MRWSTAALTDAVIKVWRWMFCCGSFIVVKQLVEVGSREVGGAGVEMRRTMLDGPNELSINEHGWRLNGELVGAMRLVGLPVIYILLTARTPRFMELRATDYQERGLIILCGTLY